MKILILTVSDRAYNKVYEDLSGKKIETILQKKIPSVQVSRKIVPDEKDSILEEYSDHGFYDVILTTGGTGLSERDITPEVTEEYCERLIPGIPEIMRSESYRQTPNAAISRAVAGMKNKTLFINLPGSVKGAAFCTDLLIPILPHAIKMVKGEGH